MKEGYKKTPVGMIPEDWRVIKQGDVAIFYNGRAYSLSEWEDHGTPVIRLQNLTGRGEEYYYSNLVLPEHQYCHKGDLLYMWSASFGAYFWQGEKAIFHYHIWKIDSNDNALDKKFHYYLLDDITQRMKNQSHGSTMMHVTKGNMEKLLIQLPPLPEQSKIASILSTVDDKIDSINQRIEETRKLKQGLMQQLLTRGIGHTRFKDSPLGEIPESWECLPSFEVFDLLHGYQFRDYDFTKEGIPIIKIGQITSNGLIDLSDPSYIDSGRLHEFEDTIVHNGDVLMALTGATLGKSCIVKNLEVIALQNYRVGKFEPRNKRILKPFLYLLINSPLILNQVFGKVNEAAQGNIGKADFERIHIPIPDLYEQQKISDILSTIYNKLDALQELKIVYEILKKGLMQQLLTGKIRVKTV
ncbi:MAG: restriction endonuclease subunit S [Candidatus Brocadiales bacterium]|nr:restriction endonuclease subunit S [Candidatus Brocadiales bacterium]